MTYTFTAEQVGGLTNGTRLIFVRSGDGFGYSTGAKEVTIQNTSETTGFTVQLDDGLPTKKGLYIHGGKKVVIP